MKGVTELEDIAKGIRKKIIQMHQKGPHIGSSLSQVDILTVLYFKIMNINSPDNPERDRFILSKGHGVSALYAVLSKKFSNEKIVESYLVDGGSLYGHPVIGTFGGIEASTGSLGHGLPIGIGLALSGKNDKKNYKIYVLMGDGECQEGSVWESAMCASRLCLDNLIAIIDANTLQGYERVDNIQPISTLKKKWEDFGWGVREVDGHNIEELINVFKEIPFYKDKPSLVLAHTIKGKGVSDLENKLESHYLSIPKEKVKLYIEKLEETK